MTSRRTELPGELLDRWLDGRCAHDAQAGRRLAALAGSRADVLAAVLAQLEGDDTVRACLAASLLGSVRSSSDDVVARLRIAVGRRFVGEEALDALARLGEGEEPVARELEAWWWSLPEPDRDPRGDERRLRIFESLPRFGRHAAVFRALLIDAVDRPGWWTEPYSDPPPLAVPDQKAEVILVARHIGLELPGSERVTAPDGWRPRRARDRFPLHSRLAIRSARP